MTKWELVDAVEFCVHLERIAPQFGAHIALTGGSLYKRGRRKDVDIIVYRIRQVEEIDHIGFFDAISRELGVTILKGFGWCYKATLKDRNIDFLFPEEVNGEYENFDPVSHAREMEKR